MTAKQFTKLIEKVLKPVFSELYKNDDLKGLPKDAADIAIFGRMVANDPSLNKEGAAAFNHALSVHKVDSEIEYFSAVDEMQPKEETGAAITGTFEFNSATYYRFATLNLDLLFDKDHLACFESKERKEIVKAFVKAMVQAIPVARRNSMNGNVAPSYVLCVIREKGHPIQLVNAFEEPIQNEKGILKESIEKLKKEYACLKERWDLDEKTKYEIPDGNLKGLLAEVEKHVK